MTDQDQFVHLHVHTEFSMLDGAAKLKDLFAEAARMGMPALAMTDHGNLYGAYEFYKMSKGTGVKPIIGMEGYYAPGSRFDRQPFDFGTAAGEDGGEAGADMGGGKQSYAHMTLLAETTQGLHNLFRVSSLASLEGFYRKPRFDRDLLQTYGTGIIATTGCPSGEVNRWLQAGNEERALAAAADFQDIFGKENFFCELMDHGLAIEQRTRAGLMRIAKKLELPLLATNDLHYTYAKDAEAHEVLLCVQTGKTLADPKRFKFDARDFYLKSSQEMRSLWRELPEACDNTLLIAERVDAHLTERNDLMPRFPVPEGESEESFLVAEVERGLHRRFPNGISDAHRKQAEYETGVILRMGFPGYFLVTADLVRWAQSQKIRVGPGRGSAAGSLVAYVMGITELDPMAHGLLFERFLNPDRISMPDIDMDFDERRRGDMIRYATERYGEERVAQIITYGTIKAKQAIKDSARVLGYPYGMGDEITKKMPPAVMGKEISLVDIFEPTSKRYGEAGEFRSFYETNPDAHRVVDTARGLEGLRRQWGVHAAGVILSDKPLLDVLPIMRREADGAIITQFDMGACESLGLLKMDFLGLRNLTVLDDTLMHIENNRGETVVLEDLPLDDRASYELLSRGDTLGVFQLDGGPMRSLLRQMAPTNFEHISAVLALYRPGPMGANAHTDYAERKNNRQEVTPIHPEFKDSLAEILDTSYGLIVYQEQVMAIAQKVAGYSLGKADLLRRAMGKKKREILDKEFEGFQAGMKENGYSQKAIDKLWEILVPFSDYAFNKAHTAGYGLVSYWTAYLKANYPSEYMAGLLTSVKDDKDKLAVYLQECRRMGIKVLPPDVNDSDANFTPRGTDIRFGLTAIRNVGANVVQSVVDTKTSQGRYADFADFLRKVELVVCNKRLIESLVKAGAFDSFGHTRAGLISVHVEAVDQCVAAKRHEAVGQFDLFADFGTDDEPVAAVIEIHVPPTEWDKATLLAFEREMLGLYVSDHPLYGVDHILAEMVDLPISGLVDKDDKAVVTIGGILSGVQRKMTKKGDVWAAVSLEDLEGSVEVMFFPQTYQAVQHDLMEDRIVLVKGRVDKREEGQPKIIAMDLMVPSIAAGDASRPLVVCMQASRCTAALVERLKETLQGHPGTTDVHLQLQNTSGAIKTLKLDDSMRITPSPSLMGDLKVLLGPACLPLG